MLLAIITIIKTIGVTIGRNIVLISLENPLLSPREVNEHLQEVKNEGCNDMCVLYYKYKKSFLQNEEGYRDGRL